MIHEFKQVQKENGEHEQKNALIIAERIRNEIEGGGILHEDSPFSKVTISMGLATLEHGMNISHPQLFDRADNAIYKAKKPGVIKLSRPDEF